MGDVILENTETLDRIALALIIVGAINWLSVGIFQLDLVAWLFGGADALLSRIVYILVGIGGIWSLSLLFKPNAFPRAEAE